MDNDHQYDESINEDLEYPDEDPDDEAEDTEGKIQCPKCTLYNPAHLNICTICGASLHKAPINNLKPKPTASGSASRAGSRSSHSNSRR